jgi:L-lactate dehydrogenase complex protein LldG
MSKEKIIEDIKKNKPALSSLPSIPDFQDAEGDLITNFKTAVESSAGKCYLISSEDVVDEEIRKLYPHSNTIISLYRSSDYFRSLSNDVATIDLSNVDVAIMPAEIGVIENGACWVSEQNAGHRILPFITQHLILVLKTEQLVSKMHQAYAKVSHDHGFGVFIAGPSKTADIEQALVIGAQAARSLTVFVITNK